jgi:hypothetical protein
LLGSKDIDGRKWDVNVKPVVTIRIIVGVTSVKSNRARVTVQKAITISIFIGRVPTMHSSIDFALGDIVHAWIAAVLLMGIIDGGCPLQQIQILREGRSLIELLAKGILGDANLPKIINTLDSGVQNSALEVIRQYRLCSSIADIIIEAHLFHKVCNERDSGLALPWSDTQLE